MLERTLKEKNADLEYFLKSFNSAYIVDLSKDAFEVLHMNHEFQNVFQMDGGRTDMAEFIEEHIVLDMARIESGKLEFEEKVLRFREASRPAMAIACEAAKERGIELTTHVGPVGDVCFYGDELKLNRIELNIAKPIDMAELISTLSQLLKG